MSIEIHSLWKRFGNFTALAGIDLEVPTGQLVALLGPSGCGKTTLLRIIAGLETADSGSILFQGEDATRRHARERGVGFVFQHYALFQHMSVFENVAFGLRVMPRKIRPKEEEIRRRVFSLLELIQLDWLAERYPSQLSGGQRQRIALARALAVEPKVLLLDEPFGALDTQVRKELRSWLRRLHDELHVTSVFVTHDQEEALEVADRIVVMNKGRIEQIGAPDEVYDNPATPFVYQFLGNVNRFHGYAVQGWAEFGGVRQPVLEHGGDAAIEVLGYARPHEIDVKRDDEQGLLATVAQVRALGPIVRIELVFEGGRIQVELTRERYQADPLQVGETIRIRPRRLQVFPAEQAAETATGAEG